MRFYCPSCQQEYEAEPSETKTTLSGRVAYKAACPACGQDMAEFVPGETITPPSVERTEPPQTPSAPAPLETKAPPTSIGEKEPPKQSLPEPGITPPGGGTAGETAEESTEAQSLLNQAVESLSPQVLEQVGKEVVTDSDDSE